METPRGASLHTLLLSQAVVTQSLGGVPRGVTLRLVIPRIVTGVTLRIVTGVTLRIVTGVTLRGPFNTAIHMLLHFQVIATQPSGGDRYPEYLKA